MPKYNNRALRRFNRARVINNRSAVKFYKSCVPVELSKGKLSKTRYIPEYGDYFKKEKSWNLLWRRGQKLVRARKLGIEYPPRSWRDDPDLMESHCCDMETLS